MNSENLVLVRGIDLFFEDITEYTLQAICKDLGGKASYSFDEQRATYMLTNDLLVDMNKLGGCHDVADHVGEYFAERYDCVFLFSELYVRSSKKQVTLFTLPDIEIVSSVPVVLSQHKAPVMPVAQQP
jgi:hypothetical protein